MRKSKNKYSFDKEINRFDYCLHNGKDNDYCFG